MLAYSRARSSNLIMRLLTSPLSFVLARPGSEIPTFHLLPLFLFPTVAPFFVSVGKLGSRSWHLRLRCHSHFKCVGFAVRALMVPKCSAVRCWQRTVPVSLPQQSVGLGGKEKTANLPHWYPHSSNSPRPKSLKYWRYLPHIVVLVLSPAPPFLRLSSSPLP